MDARSETRTWDGNEAVADVAFRLNEVIAIYPITPASPMGEWADAWAARERENLWGQVPRVIEMQSEGGAAGAVHGALQAGALTTTFTASQGLLLMVPNLYKIAGELTPAVVHVAARTVATHALSIFADHSDVYAARQTGMAMLAAGSVQEAHDLAAVAHAATLSCRIPFIHFFDGFRTSHEVCRTSRLRNDQLASMLDPAALSAHRRRALTPDRPVVRGTAQNPDVFFQAREAANPYYDACPAAVEAALDALAEATGRRYGLFDYVGHPEAERVLILMGSGAEAAHETVDWLRARGERVGLIKVRLYRPFSARHLLAALPRTAHTVAVLDRTKEPGAPGDPLYLDVVCALHEAHQRGDIGSVPRVVAGRYGLSSKEFTPAMIAGVFAAEGRTHFVVGIDDDVGGTSLPWDRELCIEPDDVVRSVFYGLGSDGTVGAAKNTVKIIGDHGTPREQGTSREQEITEQAGRYAQGFFVYDSKKSGAITVSHLRFSARPIRSTYLVRRASFVGVHHKSLLERHDVLERAAEGAVLLLNVPWEPEQAWARLPIELQRGILERGIQVWVIDAATVAREAGMGRRINTIMQTCYFAISGVLPRDEAIAAIKVAVEKTYARKGPAIVRRNFAAIDAALGGLRKMTPGEATGRPRPPAVPPQAPAFVQEVTAAMLAGRGDDLPVSRMPVDGTWPAATAKWEKRGIAPALPEWDSRLCVQCNKCALVCPHAAIRTGVWDPEKVSEPPLTFRSVPYKGKPFKGLQYAVQLSPDDCTGCTLCAVVCPAKDKANPRHKALDMVPPHMRLKKDRAGFAWFDTLPEPDHALLSTNVKDTQLARPLFEFSGACAGCGETPYIKLLTQMFGDRLVIANATGCSSIFGGNLPTTPYCTDAQGRGPAWSNSLFEDNAEFGMGMRLAVDQLTARARQLVAAADLPPALVADLLSAGSTEADIAAQRVRVEALRALLPSGELHEIADYLVTKSVWIVGGDGWAYDIGYGGVDHALASGLDVNILVLDTEVYSNTGGQQSKATPIGAIAKFAAGGKSVPKKDLGMLAMAYGDVYVAQIAMGASDAQTVRAFAEAYSWPGPSLIIAYSHCIAHGYDLSRGLDQQKRATKSGAWPLYRYDPRRAAQGKPALKMDSREPSLPLHEYMYNEGRFAMLKAADPARAEDLLSRAKAHVRRRLDELLARGRE